ncbi:type II toxin-antitoxin system VapC family toxin [Aeoliella sp.]|uniref:type II toxin-antitoxin system VapC family toxin n=1 Tax=Aeoliella sp. TaxID=2795800 RepID=UPI003CCB810A
MPLVIDASAILPLALLDEDATYSNAVLSRMAIDGVAYVPPIFWDELLNILSLGVRGGRIDLELAEAFVLRASNDLPMQTISPDSRLDILRLAYEYGLTSYDSAYLWLALKFDAEIATHDNKLIAAAHLAGVGRFESRASKASA